MTLARNQWPCLLLVMLLLVGCSSTPGAGGAGGLTPDEIAAGVTLVNGKKYDKDGKLLSCCGGKASIDGTSTSPGRSEDSPLPGVAGDDASVEHPGNDVDEGDPPHTDVDSAISAAWKAYQSQMRKEKTEQLTRQRQAYDLARVESLDSLLHPWDAPAQREALDLDVAVTNQAGKAMKLSDLQGKPLIVSFIFTRCPNPQMCPFITVRMASLQRHANKIGLGEQVTFALITYDPVYDTPERLKHYGQVRGLSFDNLHMLRPDPKQFRKVLDEFETPVQWTDTGIVGNHAMELFILDRKGRFVRQYRGMWSNVRVLSDINRLLTEQRDSTKDPSAKQAAAPTP